VIASPQRSWLQEKKPGPGPYIKPAHYVSLFSSPPVRRNLPHHGPALPFFTHHHHEIRPGALASDRPGDDAARLPLRKPRSNSDPAARSNKKKCTEQPTEAADKTEPTRSFSADSDSGSAFQRRASTRKTSRREEHVAKTRRLMRRASAHRPSPCLPKIFDRAWDRSPFFPPDGRPVIDRLPFFLCDLTLARLPRAQRSRSCVVMLAWW
jgi:hypothetical protein